MDPSGERVPGRRKSKHRAPEVAARTAVWAEQKEQGLGEDELAETTGAGHAGPWTREFVACTLKVTGSHWSTLVRVI